MHGILQTEEHALRYGQLRYSLWRWLPNSPDVVFVWLVVGAYGPGVVADQLVYDESEVHWRDHVW